MRRVHEWGRFLVVVVEVIVEVEGLENDLVEYTDVALVGGDVWNVGGDVGDVVLRVLVILCASQLSDFEIIGVKKPFFK